MVNTKHAFWQALFSAILIFGVGLILGFYFENSRNQQVEKNLINSEVNVLDSQLMQQINENFDIGCTESKEKLIALADSIYSEAQLLEKYSSSSQLTDILEVLHKRYDILRLILWTQSIELKKKCGSDFNTVVYIYQYKDPSVKVKSEQITFSRFLEDLKVKYGQEIILIPIAGDLDLKSVDLVKNSYSIDSYPAIIVNEEQVIRSVDELKDIEKALY